mgnify:FL=1
MNDTNNLPEAVEVALAELLHAQLLLGVATAKRRPTADAPEVLAASKALIAVCDAVRAALAQPAAPDRWNEGFKHGQWLAKHSAPVVERADSATPVVERSAGNVSDNAAPVAPARWYCVTNYGGATLCTGRDDAAEVAAEQDIAIPRHGPHRAVMLAEVRPARVPLTDEQAESLIENSDGRWHDGEFRIDGPDLMKLLRDAAQPAPARVPLTGAEIASMQRSANTTGVQFLQPSTVRWIVRAIEAAHGITAQGEPK